MPPTATPPTPTPAASTKTRWYLAIPAAIFVIIIAMMTGVALSPLLVPTPQPAVRKATPAKATAQKPTVKTTPAQMAPPVQAMPSRSRINVDVSTPGGSRVKVDVEEGATPVVPAPVPTPPAPAPAPQPVPAPSVQMPMPAPAPMPTLPLPAPVQPPAVTPQAPYAPMSQDIQAMSARQPTKVVNILSGNTVQFRVEVASRWGGAYGGYGYGSTYGWTPGHVARVCEERSTGPVCFDRWVAHPQPGY